jgi:hypothetical protein
MEQGPLSLVSITEELLEWKSSGSGSRRKEDIEQTRGEEEDSGK